jgi:hypothetical protein
VARCKQEADPRRFVHAVAESYDKVLREQDVGRSIKEV